MKKFNEFLNEAKDDGEYGQQGGMAKSQLRMIMSAAKRLHDSLKDDDVLPGHIIANIVLASDYVTGSADYMESEMDDEEYDDDEMDDMDEASILGPKGAIHKAASADQSDREYAAQNSFKISWKAKNTGKKWPGYEKAGFKSQYDFKEEVNLDEGLYHVSYGTGLDHQVVAKDAMDAHQKAMAHFKKTKPKLNDPKYANTFDKKSITRVKGDEPRSDKYKTEEVKPDLRITKVYNKFPKKATYAVHTSDRKYYKEFDNEAAAKAHHAEKSGK